MFYRQRRLLRSSKWSFCREYWVSLSIMVNSGCLIGLPNIQGQINGGGDCPHSPETATQGRKNYANDTCSILSYHSCRLRCSHSQNEDHVQTCNDPAEFAHSSR